jgi:sugar lactone lactonase YvrE
MIVKIHFHSFFLILAALLVGSCNKLSNIPKPANSPASTVARGTRSLAANFIRTPVVATLAGNGTPGSANGVSVTTAEFNSPRSVAADAFGNVFVADRANNQIREISLHGTVTTLAGSSTPGFAEGTGTAAAFNAPSGIVVDASGMIYVADAGNHRIRMITPAGVVSTLAGSGTPGSTNATGTAAQFNFPVAVSLDGSGNVYVADSNNHLIRMITPAGVVTTLAGTRQGYTDPGPTSTAQFNGPNGVAFDAVSGNVYVSDPGNQLIREITPDGFVLNLAGNRIAGLSNGRGDQAEFRNPGGLVVDASGNVYVADAGNQQIRVITPGGVDVSTFAGNSTAGNGDGPLTAASFNLPSGITTDVSGNLFIADMGNNRIREITAGQILSTLAGNGTTGFANGIASKAEFNSPVGAVADGSGNVYVTDNFNNVIRKITPDGVVSTFAGNGQPGFAEGTGTSASFNSPAGIAIDNGGNLYIADEYNNRIRKITPDGTVSTLAGNGLLGSVNGSAATAEFDSPLGIAIDASGNLYVSAENAIREISPAGMVTTFAGVFWTGSSDGQGTNASFNRPFGIAIDNGGNLYIADEYNNRIRKITPSGFVTTLAGWVNGFADGSGPYAKFNRPTGVAADAYGNVYVADRFNALIRKITPAGLVSTFSGAGGLGVVNGPVNIGLFRWPFGITIDASGTMYITDVASQSIRKIQ